MTADRSYSLARALAHLADPSQRSADVEIETARDLAAAHGVAARGLMVPGAALTRGQTTDTTAKGGALVGQEPDGYAAALRAALVTGRAGATILTGLRGDASIPTMTSGAAASWLEEGISGAANVGETTPTMSRGVVKPRTVAAAIPVSRRLMLQAQPEVAEIVARDLLAALASEIDAAALGTGATGAPDGLRQALAGQKVTFAGGDPTYSDLLAMERAVLDANAIEPVFALSPAMAQTLKSTERVAGTGAPHIMEDGQIVDRRAFTTAAMASNEIAFGDFHDLTIAVFSSGLDLRIDAGTGAASDTMTLRAFADVGILTRRASSFSYGGPA